MKKPLVIALSVAVVVAVLIGAVMFYRFEEAPSAPMQSVSNETDAAIRSRIVEFGSKLRNVSLLMPPADVKKQMELHYGDYLTPELLAAWQNDPAQALGNSVSSPWPERIEVVSVNAHGENTYKVEGNVIEVTSADLPMQPAAMRPVTLIVERRGESWLVSALEKGAYRDMPDRRTVEGIWECLPHRDTSGPQTEECALGIAVDQSDGHYAIDLSVLQVELVGFSAGTRVRAEGVLIPSNSANSHMWEKYPIDGILAVTSLQKI